MCCPAGFPSVLLQVLYHLGSVHPEELGSCWAPQQPFCSRMWEQTGPWLTDRHFQQILPVRWLWFHFCCSLIWTILYPNCPNLHVAFLCSCQGKTVRPDDSADTKWTRIPSHFHQRYFHNLLITWLPCSTGEMMQSRRKVWWVTVMVPAIQCLLLVQCHGNPRFSSWVILNTVMSRVAYRLLDS